MVDMLCGARNITRFAMYIPKMIHLAELNEEGLICYDGNHRREVFNLLQKDFLCIIDIIFNATQEDVFYAFDASRSDASTEGRQH
jgi:hypothetical protein